jgi:F-type H+-transporting ATPase subunit delta
MQDIAIRANAIERTYAQALLDLAQEAGQLDATIQEVNQLLDLARTEPDLARFFVGRRLTASEHAEVIEHVFQGRVSKLLYRFLLVVNRRDRLHLLDGILRGVIALFEEQHGQVVVHAYVPTLLDDAQARATSARLGAALKRTVVLSQHEDPALLGGIKLLVGDELFDGSVATQLKLMRQKMIETGREKARTAAEREGN